MTKDPYRNAIWLVAAGLVVLWTSGALLGVWLGEVLAR